MGFEIGRLVGNQTIGRRVRFIEAVSREGDDQVPELLRDLLRNSITDSARDVVRVKPGDDLFLLLADSLDTFVGFAQLDVPHAVQNPHHLFLIDHHSVGLFQNRVDRGVHFSRWLATMLHIDVFHHHPAFQRTRSIECRRGNNVGEAVGTHLRQQVPHPAGLQLKDPLRLSSLQQSKRAGIREIILDDFQIKVRVATLNVLDGLIKDRQISQTQKVHFQQTDLFNRRPVPLRDNVFLAGNCLQRKYGIQRHVGNHHTGSMRAGTACQPLNRNGEIQQLSSHRIGVVRRFQVGTFLQRVLQTNIQRFRNHLGQLVDTVERHIQCPANVPDRILRLQRSIGANLCNVALTVFLLCIVNHHLPTITTEVDVDIRRLVTTGIQKSLKQQIVLQRTDVPQSQQVRHNRTTRRTSRTAGNAVPPRKLHKVPDNQKVAGITLRLNHTQFVVKALPVRFRQLVPVPLVHPITTQIPQILNVRFLIRWTKHRVQLAFPQLHVNAIGDFLRTGNGVFQTRKSRIHLIRRTHMQTVMLHLHTFFVIDGRASIHAQHDVLNLGVRLSQIVRVVGGNQRQTHTIGQIHRQLQTLTLNLKAGVLYFHVKAVAEDSHIPLSQLACLIPIVSQQQARQFRGRAARQTDNAFAALFQ